MPNTYTQLLTQLVIAVKCRQSLILEPVRRKSIVEQKHCRIVNSVIAP